MANLFEDIGEVGIKALKDAIEHFRNGEYIEGAGDLAEGALKKKVKSGIFGFLFGDDDNSVDGNSDD